MLLERKQVRVTWTRCYKDQVTAKELFWLLLPLVGNDNNGDLQILQVILPDSIVQLILDFLPAEPFNSTYHPYPYKHAVLNMSNLFDCRVKLLILGDLGVGKTSLIQRFTNDT